MLNSGDVVRLDLGTPIGSEAGMVRPAVVVTAQQVLQANPRVVQVVPLTRTLRGWASEVLIRPDQATGIADDSSAQCQHIRAVSTERILERTGNVGVVHLARIRETVAVLIDL
ncbi:type II toxin-antitoxin system PemK/MazF family toxin [Euzebya pacifica]|jgi:mRNA interferase MazF|uniref:type II toxin-antitoxin system PemK/MazF family toxin n=1 Tax=Euzebya pacifica TaxID=1608957 RepID=UPI003C6CC654